MSSNANNPIVFEIKDSIEKTIREKMSAERRYLWNEQEYSWSNREEISTIALGGVPYEAVGTTSEKAGISIKEVLEIMELPQTTYNQKKRENMLMNRLQSELVLLIIDLLDYGGEVFNGEAEKLQNWLKTPNFYLGGESPLHLFRTKTGVDEVKDCLDRIEFGNFA